MARNKGTFKTSANYEVKIAEPLDPRILVDSKEDLINKETWPYDGDTLYLKEGMFVYVKGDGFYELIDLANALKDDYSGWKKTISGGVSDEIKEYITQYVTDQIDALIGDGTSEALDTLGELAIAIEDNQDLIKVLNSSIANKVDKEEGKGLSTNDFTTGLKTKLESITDATASNSGLVSTGAQTFAGIKTFNDGVKAKAFFETSDERLKDFKEDIEIDFEALFKINKKYFNWKKDGSRDLGVSAQQVQKLYPELVSKDNDGELGVSYGKMVTIALKAIDILYLRIKELENICYGNRN